MKLDANILILEDEPLIRLMLLSGLEEAGAFVDAVDSCSDAARLLRDGAFDVALFDYSLPDGKSTDMLRTLRAEGLTLPVVLLSAEPDSISEPVCEELSVSKVLSKPPLMDTVLRTLKDALDRTAQPSEPSGRIGSYVLWHPEEQAGLPDCLPDVGARVAIDCRGEVSASSMAPVMDFVQRSPERAVLVGGDAVLRARLRRVSREVVFVNDMDELQALNRRRTAPAERAALLGSVVGRRGTGGE